MTRNILFLFIVPITVVLLFTSCSKDDEQALPFSHLHLDFYENFHPHGREMVFYLETAETFPCNNFLISTTVELSSSQLSIKAHDIEGPSMCITSIGPATRTLMIGDSDELPSLTSFWVVNDRHDFELQVREDFINIYKHSTFKGRLSFTKDTLMRIPDNTVWGFVVSENEEKMHNHEDLINAFLNEGAQAIALANGDYHYFEVKEQEVLFHSQTLRNNSVGFALWFDKELEILLTAFEQYAQETQQPDLRIRLFNTKGERILQ